MALQLPPYPMQPAPAWVLPYIGLPYEKGARGPDAWDCWGLLLKVHAEQFDIVHPAYEGVQWGKDRESRTMTADVVNNEARDWLAVTPGEERAGDALTLAIAGNPLHCGIVASPGWMLHSAEDADSSLERYDGMVWRSRVLGIHRPRALA